MNSYNDIVKKINKAKTDYYQTGRSELTDKEYDRLVSIAEKYGYTETVGAAPVDHIEKITHEHPMLSLDKCHTIDEVLEFINGHDVLYMYKADGLTVSATYIDGELTRLETRGNGMVGNDIMFHAKSIENLPLHIDKGGKYVVDGECVILLNDFAAINNKLAEGEKYSHARNLAAGTLNLLDPAISAKRHLRFYVWDVIENQSDCKSLFINLNEAHTLGFDTVVYDLIHLGKPYNSDAVEIELQTLRNDSARDNFPIDGVVIKYDDIAYGKSLGKTEHHFRNAIAFKYADETYETKLKEIIWQCGKTGKLAPIAVVDPVDCSGVTVEKCSVHNISIIKKLGLTNHCTCYIKRANSVIPQIDYAEQDGDTPINIPATCPSCGMPTVVIKQNNTEELYCVNDNCHGKLLGLWETFVSKKGMDIEGWSSSTLERFLRLGYLTNMFVSIYELDQYKKELYKLDGFGKKSIDNLLYAVEASKNCEFKNFLASFSIPGVGEAQSKVLAQEFQTFDNFKNACDDGFMFDTLPGFGKVLNANIHQWWVNNHMQMIDVAEVVHLNEEFMNKPEWDYPLLDVVFVITGKLQHYPNRDALKAEIESLGGKVAGSVSKSTNYLINNDNTSMSGKNQKAKSIGVPIITEEQYMALINKN